jgi:predicted metallopeptidase
MPISYGIAKDLHQIVEELIRTLRMQHVASERVICFRSHGSKSRNVIARCYPLSKIWQQALDLPAYYIIEVISERFDPLSQEERIKVMIHELMHIPLCFGGGLRPHKNCVTRRAVEEKYRLYLNAKKGRQ